jgi:hypothetical protein
MSRRKKLDEFIEQKAADQRNIVFPDTVRNGRSVDVFLWRGSPDPTIVQRIAAWMIGLFLVSIGLGFLTQIRSASEDEYPWAGYVVGFLWSFACIAGGAKVFRNGFRNRSRKV